VDPSILNAHRAAALDAFSKKEQRSLRLPPYLVGRAGPEGPELGLRVGYPEGPREAPSTTQVRKLLDALADSGAPVRHLERHGRSGDRWNATHFGQLLRAKSVGELRSLELWDNLVDTPACEAVGSAGLVSLEHLDLRVGPPLTGDALRALAAGDLPRLKHLSLRALDAEAEELLTLIPSRATTSGRTASPRWPPRKASPRCTPSSFIRTRRSATTR